MSIPKVDNFLYYEDTQQFPVFNEFYITNSFVYLRNPAIGSRFKIRSEILTYFRVITGMGSDRNTIKVLLIHMALWSVYILSEYAANFIHLRPGEELIFWRATLLSLPLLMLPTYFIVLVAIPRYLKPNRFALFALVIIAMAVLIFAGRIKWMELIEYLNHGHFISMPAGKVLKNVIRDYAVVALAVCIYIIGDWRRKQKINEQLVKAKAETEIKLLKGQLHPHFLFNTLNNIYSLALKKSELTADSILKLTELLDYLVYWTGKDKVEISKEVQLIKNYLELEKLRHGDKLKLDIDLDIADQSELVTPLILLPFIENCFKHGGAKRGEPFLIKMKLRIYSKKLVFNVENSKKSVINTNNENSGIGLKNIRERLQLVYPLRHQLVISNNTEFFGVRLELTL